MDLSLHFPFNSTSLGQCSHSIAREFYNRGLNPNIFHIGQPDHTSIQESEEDFIKWIVANSVRADETHSRKNKVLKLWHMQGSMESYSEKQILYTFYELDAPTRRELNILKNQDTVIMPSKHYADLFAGFGVDVKVAPLGFDKNSFSRVNINYPDNRICFGLAGKLEHRKHHLKILNAWAKKYGNRRDVYLNCALYNNFIDKENQSAMINHALGGNKFYNINFIPWIPKNEEYNKFLNANHIIIAMSGGESWGLPEFTSVALGKHCVGLRAHGYKEWMNQENSVCISPVGKIPAYDNMFFREGAPFNQGNIFDFSADEFLDACDVAINKAKENPVNKSGLELQEKFSWQNSVNSIIDIIK